MKVAALSIFIALLLCTGCSDQQQVAGLRRDVADTQKKLIVIEQKAEALAAEVAQLKQSQDWEKFIRDLDRVAFLTPGSNGYSVLRYELGFLTVSFTNVEPYANGSRITLKFGNPLSASINGVEGTIEYGTVDEKGNPKNLEAKRKDISFSESLTGGAWTSVQIVLEGVPNDKLGFVRVKDLKHSGISLSSKK